LTIRIIKHARIPADGCVEGRMTGEKPLQQLDSACSTGQIPVSRFESLQSMPTAIKVSYDQKALCVPKLVESLNRSQIFCLRPAKSRNRS
jgi:hypothetical protein